MKINFPKSKDGNSKIKNSKKHKLSDIYIWIAKTDLDSSEPNEKDSISKKKIELFENCSFHKEGETSKNGKEVTEDKLNDNYENESITPQELTEEDKEYVTSTVDKQNSRIKKKKKFKANARNSFAEETKKIIKKKYIEKEKSKTEKDTQKKKEILKKSKDGKLRNMHVKLVGNKNDNNVNSVQEEEEEKGEEVEEVDEEVDEEAEDEEVDEADEDEEVDEEDEDEEVDEEDEDEEVDEEKEVDEGVDEEKEVDEDEEEQVDENEEEEVEIEVEECVEDDEEEEVEQEDEGGEAVVEEVEEEAEEEEEEEIEKKVDKEVDEEVGEDDGDEEKGKESEEDKAVKYFVEKKYGNGEEEEDEHEKKGIRKFVEMKECSVQGNDDNEKSGNDDDSIVYGEGNFDKGTDQSSVNKNQKSDNESGVSECSDIKKNDRLFASMNDYNSPNKMFNEHVGKLNIFGNVNIDVEKLRKSLNKNKSVIDEKKVKMTESENPFENEEVLYSESSIKISKFIKKNEKYDWAGYLPVKIQIMKNTENKKFRILCFQKGSGRLFLNTDIFEGFKIIPSKSMSALFSGRDICDEKKLNQYIVTFMSSTSRDEFVKKINSITEKN
ncbi:conserved Plasmodium protein, unknown function [Plasmodium malariae]|uniref:RanBD1 domain-containing protein n=1 Tax=Plasmodium malariae TaxID=5858 RepID=A0A1D3JIJ2_PLAMA|nr:conserved Plasmodium protein, unknown function [Plasmodium malariae]SBT86191.1 conserved Plasmodium protein, unknown function [Plasmodium malariae]